ncbi:MAG: hypothetical protein IJB59_04715 [Oscillospiraceae bacterium]|nr:hypothetical protein [Oscillospiraceae bacterium]
MKEWLRVLPFPILIFAVLTFLDFYADPQNISWLWNFVQAAVLGAIGCVGQFLIHKNILQDNDEDSDQDGCISCGKPE